MITELFSIQDEKLGKHEEKLRSSIIALTSACVEYFIEDKGMEDIPEGIDRALDSAQTDLTSLVEARKEFEQIVKAVCSE